jgi:hypothetical protein
MAKVTYSGPVPENDPMFTGKYELFTSPRMPTDDEASPETAGQGIVIQNARYWVKIVDFLQQNWALIDDAPASRARIYFINDTSRVFDELDFETIHEAEEALGRNGFRDFSKCPDLQNMLRSPQAPFFRGTHPKGPIYSSGQFWI